MEEIWKPVPGYHGKYSVSNLGRVRRNNYTIRYATRTYGFREKMLKSSINKDGYYHISLHYNNTAKVYKTHRLVWMTFVSNGNFEGYIDHINFDKLDNRLVNLRVCTPQENAFHRRKSNRSKGSKYKGVNKLPSGNFAARIIISGKMIWIGTYKTEEEAAQAFNDKAIILQKEFAYLN